MNDPEQIATRYLLGELAEPEQTALEEKYFADPQLFDQLVKAETELVDDYARGRLSPAPGRIIPRDPRGKGPRRRFAPCSRQSG